MYEDYAPVSNMKCGYETFDTMGRDSSNHPAGLSYYGGPNYDESYYSSSYGGRDYSQVYSGFAPGEISNYPVYPKPNYIQSKFNHSKDDVFIGVQAFIALLFCILVLVVLLKT
jgi:hypothetical protein